MRRRLAAFGREIADAALSPASEAACTLIDDAGGKLDELAIEGTRGSLSAYTAGQLAHRPSVNRAWVIDGWMPARTNVVFGGHGGTGKSMLMAMLAVCVSAGVPFYGLSSTRGPVLIYSCEDDVDEYLYRMRRAAEHMRVEFGELPITLVDALDSGADPALFASPPDDARAQAKLTPAGARLSQIVRATRPVLVILDAATDTFSGDEIRRREVRRYLRAMQHALAAWGPCVLHVLHVDKIAARGATTTDLYSGSTDWNNGVRARLAFYRPRLPGGEDEGEYEAGEASLRLELQKANYAKRGAFIELRYDEQAHVFVQVGGSEIAAAGGLVESIERRNAEEAIVAFVGEAQAKNDPVHAGQRANRNLHFRMRAADALPASFAGRSGPKRLFALVERLRAQGRVGVSAKPDGLRKQHDFLTITADAAAKTDAK